jgi:hypothetical protein
MVDNKEDLVSLIMTDGKCKLLAANLVKKYELIKNLVEMKTAIDTQLVIKLPCSINVFTLADSICDIRTPSIKRAELDELIKVMDYLACDMNIVDDLRNLCIDKIDFTKKSSNYVNVIDMYLWEYHSQSYYEHDRTDFQLYCSWEEFVNSEHYHILSMTSWTINHDSDFGNSWQCECEESVTECEDDKVYFDHYLNCSTSHTELNCIVQKTGDNFLTHLTIMIKLKEFHLIRKYIEKYHGKLHTLWEIANNLGDSNDL